MQVVEIFVSGTFDNYIYHNSLKHPTNCNSFFLYEYEMYFNNTLDCISSSSESENSNTKLIKPRSYQKLQQPHINHILVHVYIRYYFYPDNGQ